MALQGCLKLCIDKYNEEVFSNYDKLNSDVFDTTLMLNYPRLQSGGSVPTDYTMEPASDSYYNPSVNGINHGAMNQDLLGKKLFLIIGGGPIGMSLAANLCDAYPDYTILIVESRLHKDAQKTEIQHMRAPFGRARRLYGLGYLAINDVEGALYTVLLQRTNIRFLFVKSPTIVYDLVYAYKPIFVFNCTGNRLTEFENDIADTLILNRDKKNRVMKIMHNRTYNRHFIYRGDKLELLPLTQNGYHYLDKEYITTFTQGDSSLDVWTKRDTDNSLMGVMPYQAAWGVADTLIISGVVESPPTTAISAFLIGLDKKKDVTVSKFVAGLRIHSRYPCQMHIINDLVSAEEHIIVKFDLGDSLGTVPVRYGTNIAIGRKIIMSLLLPTIADMIDCFV